VEVVGDEQGGDGELGEQVLELGAHDGAGVGVQGGEWLVEEQDGRLACDGARQGDSLALAAGDRGRPFIGEVGDAEALEQVVDAPPAAEGDVGSDGHVREQRVLLEHEADGALLRRQVDAVVGVEPDVIVARDPPGLWAAQAGHGAQHGRLAGARGSDQRDGLALGGQAELEPVCAKGEGDVELERRHVESSL